MVKGYLRILAAKGYINLVGASSKIELDLSRKTKAVGTLLYQDKTDALRRCRRKVGGILANKIFRKLPLDRRMQFRTILLVKPPSF